MKRACPPEASLKNRVVAPPVVRMVELPAVLWLKNSIKLLLVMSAFPAVLALKKLSAPLLVIAALPAELESMNERMPILLVIVALPAELKVVKRTFPRLLLMVALPAVAAPLNVRALTVLLMTALSAEEKSRNSRLPPRTLMVALPAPLVSRNNTEDNAGALVMVAFPALAPSLNTMREVGRTFMIVALPAVLLFSKLTMSLLKIVALPPFTMPAPVNRTSAIGESVNVYAGAPALNVHPPTVVESSTLRSGVFVAPKNAVPVGTAAGVRRMTWLTQKPSVRLSPEPTCGLCPPRRLRSRAA